VVDLNQDRLDLATDLGAAETLLAGGTTLPDRLAELGMDPDVFFEVSGSAPGLASVLSAAQPGATIVPLGIQKGDVPLPLGQWTLERHGLFIIEADLPDSDEYRIEIAAAPECLLPARPCAWRRSAT